VASECEKQAKKKTVPLRTPRGRGALTCAALLVHDPDSDAAPMTTTAQTPTQPTRVLVVEDERDIRRVFQLTLSEAGCVVETADNGRQALGILMQENFDVLVVDLRMQEMDGLLFLQEALKIWPWLGVVVCSAFVDDDVLPRLERLGVKRVLVKPVSLPLLCQNVREEAEARARRGADLPRNDALTLMRDHLKLLARLSHKTIATETLLDALLNFGKELVRLLPSDVVGILVAEEDEDHRDLLLGCHTPVAPNFLTQVEQEICARYEALSGRRLDPALLRLKRDGAAPNPAGPQHVGSSLSVPVILNQQVCGLLTLASAAQEAYGTADVALLYHAANHISAVFTALRRMMHLATRDHLTGVFNRIRLEDELERAWLMSRRYGYSMGVIIVDLDNFKTLNDTFGHAVGDEVLRGFAQLFRGVARASDIIARYGGDEFVAILPRAEESDARRFGERLLSRMREHVFCPDSHQLSLTVSIGIATSTNPTAPATGEELLSQADRALFMAKRAGRDRICLWPGHTVVSATRAPDGGGAAAAETKVETAKVRDHILVVDDEQNIRDLVRMMLEREGYDVTTAASATEALEAIRAHPDTYDVLLTDLALPGKSGIELLHEAASEDDTLVRIVMTGYATVDAAVNCLREGAYDFIQKPIRHTQLGSLIRRALEFRRLKVENTRYQLHLEDEVRRRSAQLAATLDEVRRSYQFTLEALVAMLDARERQTARHSLRTRDLTVFLAQRMGVAGDDLQAVASGAFLHDIGKIAIPDEILLKQGPLAAEEWEVMKQHSEIGYNILRTSPYLRAAADIVHSHHERYDGSGYPQGLRGHDIPLGARIFAVIDAYDSMRSARVYRQEPLSPAQALAEIERGSGRQFDPEVVHVFLQHKDDLERLLSA